MMLRSQNLVGWLVRLLHLSPGDSPMKSPVARAAGRQGWMPSQRCWPQPGCALPCRGAEVHRQGGPQQGPAVFHQRGLSAVSGWFSARVSNWATQLPHLRSTRAGGVVAGSARDTGRICLHGVSTRPCFLTTCHTHATYGFDVLTSCSDFGFDPLGLLDPANSGGFVNPSWLQYSEVCAAGSSAM